MTRSAGTEGDASVGATPPDPFEWVAAHSLLWLVIANLVGLWLATLLLFPRLGDVLAPLTYGRWVPLHLDLHLYGWCSLPAVGMLLKFYLPNSFASAEQGLSHHADLERLGWLCRLAISVWSACLLFAALWWLDGGSSGKLFLEWQGPARVVVAATLAFLAIVLSIAFLRQVRSGDGGNPATVVAKALLLAGLFAVPAVLYWAAGGGVYPSFNPDSGGATGGSLMGSTLGLVAIFCLTPLVLGLRRVGHSPDALMTDRRLPVEASTLVILTLHFAWFLILDHGNRSHHELIQIVSLTSLVIWIPLLRRYLRVFQWPAESRRWLRSLATWGALLVATGVFGFLPGVLEQWKFTNALVGHAHIAMAGLVTSFNVLVLLALPSRAGSRPGANAWIDALADTDSFWLWQLGLAVQVIALFVLGFLEGTDPGLVVRWPPVAAACYGARWVGGAAMFIASLRWLLGALGIRIRRPADVGAVAGVEGT